MANSRVCVTRITVEYVVGRKVFSVDLKPMEVSSIFFDKEDRRGAGGLDLLAAQDAQRARPGARKVDEQEFIPERRLQDQAKLRRDLGSTTSWEIGTVPSQPSGPSLWWHTKSCAWFHPKG
ncbi:MAG: hypothetical protein ACKVZ0_25030 [Gemmatimonadales bacterium]